MNQYCYNIITTDTATIDDAKLKDYVGNLYRRKKFKELAFTDEEKSPFIVIFTEKDNQVCIKLTSKAKKNVERIEKIHSKLTTKDLQYSSDIKLSKPVLFELEQCAWWDKDCQLGKDSVKWTTLEHNGPYFVHILEPYEAHGAPIIYDGQEYKLNPAEERIANFYARRIISEQSGNVAQKWTTDKVFNQNFWNDFKEYLTPSHKKVFKNFSKLDFTPIVDKLLELKEEDKQLSQKEKNQKKIKLAEKKQNYGYAIINGIKEPLGNFTIEPAAIFYGRGDNPKRGKIKRDIEPEEIIINIGKDAPVPVPPPGHQWKEVIHDQNLAWIASWKDPISNENKYVYFAAEGQLKGKSDYVKYEKARKLNKYLDKIRNQYTADIKDKSAKSRQLGTVLYLIDNYGIRVGNEKDESETDTVGASTLRVEHVKLKPPNIVIFDFLGKDSIRYYKEIPVSQDVYNNFVEFIKSKKDSDSLFDKISATDINAYLKTFDKDFSAKVFRTRLASTVMDAALKNTKVKKNATQDDKKKIFTKANIEVAKLLNHQRTVSAKSQDTIKKYKAELKDLRAELKKEQDNGKEKAVEKLKLKIQKKKDQIAGKQDTLNIAINTSLTNYIDPRIVVAWSKANEMNIPKAYSSTLQRKFTWATDITDEDWDYQDTDLLPEMATLQPVDASALKAKPASKSTTKPKPSAKPTTTSKPKPSAKPTTTSKPKPSAKPTIVVQEPAKDVKITDYSEKSILVTGNTKPYAEILSSLNGKWNPKLKGWIFSKKRRTQVEEALQITSTTPTLSDSPPIKKQTTFEQTEIETDNPTVNVIAYSPKSIIIIGETEPLEESFEGIGGKYKDNLNISGTITSGWLFSKDDKDSIMAVLEEALTPTPAPALSLPKPKKTKKKQLTEKTLDDIMMAHQMTKKERNIIKCFGRDPNVVKFLKSELTGFNVNEKIYTKDFLAKFLACLDSFDKDKKAQQAKFKEYQKQSFGTLANDVVSRLKPSTVPTFLFLIFILYKVSSRMKNTYLSQLVKHLEDTKDIQECLCDNAEQESLIAMDKIKTLPMKELYLLPSGRCIHLDDLIQHLKMSENKIADPTWIPQKGKKADLTWNNGWELRAMLDRIQDYNLQDGLEIKKNFKKVVTDIAKDIPAETKELINDMYVLFYFPEAKNNQQIIDMLVKYGYPNGEAPGKLAAAQAIVAKGTDDQLDEFRTLLGFKLGNHIVNELDDNARDAVLFAGEFAGMGKEAWGKLSMGEFCTKTFGTILHRMSDLFTGSFTF